MTRFWDCAVEGCPNPAAIDVGGCMRCQSMYCSTHIRSVLHSCKAEPLYDEEWEAAITAELVALKSKTNHEALLRHAIELSGGKSCRLDGRDPLDRSLMGGMHVHLQLIFEDGTVWLARILRETYTSFNNQVSNDILLSECATLRWLESVDVPTPRLHGYGLRGDVRNEVGVAYMLIDKLPGKPFDSASASDDQRSKVLDGWAKVLFTLGTRPFDSIGSLKFAADGKIKIGAIASDRTGTLPCIGPFDNAEDLYSSWAGTYLDLIADGQLFSSISIDAYIMYKYLQQQVRAGSWLKRWENVNSGPFFLKHTDDKGDHILVDDNFEITGIIDWTFARVVPAYEALGPSLVSANNGDLFDGKPGVSDEDGVLAQGLQTRKSRFCYFESDEIRRFLLLGLGLTKDELVTAFQAIVTTFEGKPLNWQEWRQRCQEVSKQVHRKLQALGLQFLDSLPAHPWTAIDQASVVAVVRLVRGTCVPFISFPSTTIVLLLTVCKVDDATWEMGINREVESILTQVNVPELIRVASSLRNNQPCQFRPGKHHGSGAIMGCANYHGWILFDDGVKWLARIPRTTTFSDIPSNLVEYLVESEYATLKWLEHIGVSAPKAYAFGLSSNPDNLVGVSYILEDAMPGKPFYHHQATADQKATVYRQYAGILTQISRHPLAQACSLVLERDAFRQGPIASNRFLTLAEHGPFKSPLEYFTSIAELYMELISDGQIYPEYPKEAFIFYRLLRNRVAPLLATASTQPAGFFLKHVDDKGDHILVDEDYNITAVIDWQFARFVPACEAFGPSLFTADLGSLYSGTAGLSADDLLLAESLRNNGSEDLADTANGSELARRFHFGLASGLMKKEVLDMIGAVLSLLDGEFQVRDMEVGAWVEAEWEKSSGEQWNDKVRELAKKLDECAGLGDDR
ncbi:Methylglyoxal reductase (NADPH-dependent) [Fusarium albosuccineum]|uniref:Methylglyoxal reductase (NADPH-dependent) n=1 Tax=Fusarium albosuccineum TaxID=1237068 RepID=A0A8H4PEH0_9HYPO|nr:Methylglyoxal reductase (NADPH-dependent) [Fusarium albosuccineum]